MKKRLRTTRVTALLLWLFATIQWANAQAQTGTVKGLVKSEMGDPLPNVTVIAKNNVTQVAQTALTDEKGMYAFTALGTRGSYKFSFSYLGYEPQTLGNYNIVAGQSITMMVRMVPTSSVLNQLVVTGYATQRKKDLTGAVSIIKVGDLNAQPVAGLDAALKGQASGVSIANSNQPGGGVALRIRGFGTINNNDPLYVIDGIPVTGNIGMLNPADIESVQILKDASSASIYGARASNGVVIITTKTAKTGKSQLSIDSYEGLQLANQGPELLNAQQFGDVWFTALKNAGQKIPTGNPYGIGPDPVIPEFLDAAKTTRSANTNWYKEITQPATTRSHTLTLSNGSTKGNTVFNLGYFDQKGVVKHSSGYSRISSRFNSDYTFFKRLKVGEFASVSYSRTQGVSENSALGSAMGSVYNADPIMPVYDINGNFAGPAANAPTAGRNPLSPLFADRNNYTDRWRILAKAFADLEITDGLKLSTNFAVDYLGLNGKDFNPTYAEGNIINNTNSVSYRNFYAINTTWTNTISYKKTINKHYFDALAGSEYIRGTDQSLSAARSVLPSNDINVQQLDAGTVNPTNSGSGSQMALFSLFGKLSYSYADKYLASFTLRRDASSRLPYGNNSEVFPAFSLGWRISDEQFFSPLRNYINEFKLRYGWGQNGNQQIANYAYFATFAPSLSGDNSYYDITGSNTSAQTGFAQATIGNPLLRWETSAQHNLGLDISALKNQLTLTVNLFDKRTKDLLVQPALPGTFGSATPPFVNGGTMSNRGIEVEMGYNPTKKGDWSYGVSGNISYIKNKLSSLSSDVSFIASPVSNTLTRNLELQRSVVGLPIASFYGYRVKGIFQNQQEVDAHAAQPGKAIGHFIFADEDGNGTVDNNDRVFLGSPIPTLNFGLNLKGSYKNFDVWAFMQGASGNKIFNFTRLYTDFFSSPSPTNKSTRLLNAWSPQNPVNDGPPMVTVSNSSNDTRPSSYFVENGAYARLKTLQLGYTFGHGIFKDRNIASLRIYLQAQNLFTITKYQGLDPEVGLQNYGNGNRNLDMGVDRGLYPMSKIYMIGINAKF